MDQELPSEALSQSAPFSPKKLSAEAPEFVPRSSAVAPPSKPVQRVYARPPFVAPLPPTYYGYDNYYQQNTMPFYGYNVSPVSPVELGADRNNGSTATSTKTGLSDAHLKILNQVEFYFSDINLATTDQLFKYMSKDPEGYVPLSVVASFKKIKSAISSNTQLVTILQSSRKLLVSEDGKKVKRQNPLSESDMEELQSRIVIAENLPEDHSHQNLMKIFSSVGSVKSIRTCPPQNSNNGASSVSKTGKGDVMHLSGKFHAYVEYETIELAEKAVVELTDEGNWRNTLKVRLLLKTAVKPTQVRAKKVGSENGKKDETTAMEMQCVKENNHLEDSFPQSDSQFHEQQFEDNGSSSSSSSNSNAQRRGGRNYNGNGNGKSKGKGKGQKQGQGRGGRSSEYVAIEAASESSEKFSVSRTNPVPRMPDGTKGFSMGRGKPVAVKIA